MDLFFDKLVVFVVTYPLLTGAFVLCVIIALFLELTKGGKKITVSQLVQMMNQDQALVVDVRQPQAFEKGHIAGSVNLPLTKIMDSISFLTNAKGKQPVLVCDMGMSTGAVAEKLHEKGLSVTRLAGGIGEWQNANIPLVTKSK